MAKLPINGAQYDKVIALVDFIGTAEKLVKLNEITNFKFTPKIDGYEFFAVHNGYEINVKVILNKSRLIKSARFDAAVKNIANGEITGKKLKSQKTERIVEFTKNLFEICGLKTK